MMLGPLRDAICDDFNLPAWPVVGLLVALALTPLSVFALILGFADAG